MSGTGRFSRISQLFLQTIGRRLIIALLSRSPLETSDADGHFRTLTVRRPAKDHSQERGDFEAVRRDLQARRQLKVTVVEAVPVIFMTVILGWQVLDSFLTGSFKNLIIFIIPAVLFFGAVFAGMTWWRTITLDAPEESIAAAWLRQGCCPHCAYRLPPHDPAVILQSLRCTECGCNWRILHDAPSSTDART